MLAVLGVLKNKVGLEIKKEMLSWLEKEYDVFCCEQEPPGTQFEYPAIKCALNLAVEMNEPVLYVHTKGSGNLIPADYKNFMMHESVNFPKEAKPEDCQRVVRMMWAKEFTGENVKKYLKVLNTDEPTVACPLTGKEKITWQNGWIINPAGAKELLKTFHLDKNRYYYEWMFNNTKVNVIGILSNNCHAYEEQHHKTMYDIIWKYFNEYDIIA